MGKSEILKAIAKNLNELAEVLQGEVSEPEQTKSLPQKKTAVTLEQVRTKLAGLSATGHTSQVRDLIEKYGATKLSEVDPVHYAGLLEDAENVS